LQAAQPINASSCLLLCNSRHSPTASPRSSGTPLTLACPRRTCNKRAHPQCLGHVRQRAPYHPKRARHLRCAQCCWHTGLSMLNQLAFQGCWICKHALHSAHAKDVTNFVAPAQVRQRACVGPFVFSSWAANSLCQECSFSPWLQLSPSQLHFDLQF